MLAHDAIEGSLILRAREITAQIEKSNLGEDLVATGDDGLKRPKEGDFGVRQESFAAGKETSGPKRAGQSPAPSTLETTR